MGSNVMKAWERQREKERELATDKHRCTQINSGKGEIFFAMALA
jgi:hypothetical protein